jgi:hypothetical protein
MRKAALAAAFALVAAVAVVAATAHADTAAGGRSIGFSEHGFSIDAPVGHDWSQMQQVVTLMLPASEGFSPNVNVQVQPFAGTVEEYLTVSKEQFKSGGITLLSEKHDAKTTTIEYKGTMQGRALHWYARAFLGKNGLVLATATALESQWKGASAALKKSVDSLKPL